MTANPCVICQTELPKGKRKLCSKKCVLIHQNNRQRNRYVYQPKEKLCVHCAAPFHFNGGTKKFCSPQCRKSNYKEKHVASQKEKLNAEVRYLRNRLKKYALTIEDYELELRNQNYVCAICRQPETSTNLGTLRQLSIDHNHKTGCYRGLLCGKCNRGLGYFKDDIAILKLAIEYLERHKDPRDNT